MEIWRTRKEYRAIMLHVVVPLPCICRWLGRELPMAGLLCMLRVGLGKAAAERVTSWRALEQNSVLRVKASGLEPILASPPLLACTVFPHLITDCLKWKDMRQTHAQQQMSNRSSGDLARQSLYAHKVHGSPA